MTIWVSASCLCFGGGNRTLCGWQWCFASCYTVDWLHHCRGTKSGVVAFMGDYSTAVLNFNGYALGQIGDSAAHTHTYTRVRAHMFRNAEQRARSCLLAKYQDSACYPTCVLLCPCIRCLRSWVPLTLISVSFSRFEWQRRFRYARSDVTPSWKKTSAFFPPFNIQRKHKDGVVAETPLPAAGAHRLHQRVTAVRAEERDRAAPDNT